MKYLLLLIGSVSLALTSMAQAPLSYSVANAHSHNDYEKKNPFWGAYNAGFGSIEADVFLVNDELVVGHDRKQVEFRRTLDSLYLRPLSMQVKKNGGWVYADTSRSLQLMIDLKTAGEPALSKLISDLQKYPELINSKSLHFVISGNRPDPSTFGTYPSWLMFDGELGKSYQPSAMAKIAMLSDDFKKYSDWNGKGKIPSMQMDSIKRLIGDAHRANKTVRFYNAPDILNAWYAFTNIGVNYVNTDQLEEITQFFTQMPKRKYTAPSTYKLYAPKWRNDGLNKPVKNIILLIGDGTALPQWYSGYTANHAALNVFNMHYTGQSKTSSFDNYITDSAPGATAFSSGEKTNNRAVGVDHFGKDLLLLPEIIRKKNMKTAVLTSGDLRDATPAAFYAHVTERSNNPKIIRDLMRSSVDIIMGSCPGLSDSLLTMIGTRYKIYRSIDQYEDKKLVPSFIADSIAALSMLKGRGDWAMKSFDKVLNTFTAVKQPFFLMYEGAQIDHGGHANDLPYVVTEVMDFDQVIGRAMEFADSNGETLVVVAADHETGGLTLTDGDFKTGMVGGHFSTGDHTAIPIPVFAYGPQSYLFSGVYENVAIFGKLLKALGLEYDKKY